MLYISSFLLWMIEQLPSHPWKMIKETDEKQNKQTNKNKQKVKKHLNNFPTVTINNKALQQYTPKHLGWITPPISLEVC